MAAGNGNSNINERVAALERDIAHVTTDRARIEELAKEMFALHQASVERIVEGHNQAIRGTIKDLGEQMARAVEVASGNMRIETDRWIKSFWAFIKTVAAFNSTVLVVVIGTIFGGGAAVKAILEVFK